MRAQIKEALDSVDKDCNPLKLLRITYRLQHTEMLWPFNPWGIVETLKSEIEWLKEGISKLKEMEYIFEFGPERFAVALKI